MIKIDLILTLRDGTARDTYFFQHPHAVSESLKNHLADGDVTGLTATYTTEGQEWTITVKKEQSLSPGN